MSRLSFRLLLALLLCVSPTLATAQGRSTGQIVGTVKDPSGAVVASADVILIDVGTKAIVNAKSGANGGFTFPNLQPGHYQITASHSGFQPVVLQDVVVETGRSTDIVAQFQLGGVSEQVKVEGQSVIATTSTTVSDTVNNAEIAKLPLAGRNLLNFALLVPGSATSAGARDSEYNGLPGGAINITLDGINDNSARFRSGGTSFFTFAPIRMGAIEEVTVSTSGLTSESGAEGAVQIQFTTKRGTNDFRGQVFDQISDDRLNANSFVNAARGIPKTKLRQHEWGANFGGPIVRNKLFFFGNFEQIYSPSEATITRTVLTPEAQSGVFRYTATDGSVRTINLLDVARANGLPSAIDPYIASQFSLVNGTLNQGVVSPVNLYQNTFSFINPNTPNDNVYPTGRVDYRVTPNLNLHGVLNLQWRNLPTSPNYPGLPQLNNGFTSTYYILSTGADWTVKPNLFYQMSFGGQSNYEEFNPGNTLALYDPQGGRRITFPGSTMTAPQPTNDVMPIPRNNPVWNFANNFTWLKGSHTWTFGGTFRRTTMYESIGGAPLTTTIGIASGDPAQSVFTSSTLPGIRSNDLTTALNLYALLVGRVSSAGGTYFLDETTDQYRLGPAFRREAQNVGGLYLQDAWRANPRLTFNYGLRWEFTGAAHNTNGVYSGPTVADLYGPSTAPFQPGTLDGVQDPQINLRPHPYKSDFVNPAPNAGVAWHPTKRSGWIGQLLGDSVYRGNVGVNYYDEGLINFQTAAGNGPGLSQTLALPPVTPGSLSLQTPLPAFTATPASFTFPIPMSGFTFNRGFATVDPDIRVPWILNWTIGYQRALSSDSAIEIRYVGNRGHHLWSSYDLNESNIVENGFLQEFQHAQTNLQVNTANGLNGFANNGLPGEFSLPIFETAFGPRGSAPAFNGFTNGAFLTELRQGEAGRMANTLAGSGEFRYLCAMVGSKLPACASRGYDAPGPYPINFFQTNPFAAGSAVRLLTDIASSRYDALQMQFRKRYGVGLTVTANYTYGHARTNRFVVGSDNVEDFHTLRDESLDWGPTAYDLRHNFQTYWTYDLPIGPGRRKSFSHAFLNEALGGWSVSGIVRAQTGRPFLLTSGRQTLNQQDAGVVLNGISVSDLQKMINVRPGPNGAVFFVDDSLIGPDGRANPQVIASPTTPGQQGQYVYLYGPGLWSVDLSIAKVFRPGATRRVDFEALLVNAFNTRDTIVGATGGATIGIDSTTFGQTTGTALSARQVQFRLGFYF
jgi:hypothetical protein